MGKARDKYRRMGPGATVRDVIDKLESEYGIIETKETICRKFYASRQDDKENISDYASRVEESYCQAIKLKGLQPDEDILKSVIYEGLKKDIKRMATYKYETVHDVDKFKIELRKMEYELKTDNAETSTKKCSVVTIDQNKGELNDIKKLLEQLNSRIDRLEKDKEVDQQQNEFYIPRNIRRGQRTMRGGSSFMNRGRGGRGSETRPHTATNMFSPTCWWCAEKGHMQRDCPRVPTCWKCNEKGHLQNKCPKE